MALFEKLNTQEREAVEEFRMRMRDSLSPEMQEDIVLFYRFLKARDFDVNKAESMLRKHIIWRKALKVDTILLDFKPYEAFEKYVLGTNIGEDKEGCPVRYIPAGNIYVQDFVKSAKINDFMKHWIHVMEKDLANAKAKNIKKGRNSWQVVYILNLDKLQLLNVMHPLCLSYLLRLAEINQDHFPERMKAFYIINAPPFYIIVYAVVKRVLAPHVISKIHIYGRYGWMEELLKNINADVLPAFLGGNRTDPDGNPLCNTFMCHGARFPPKYFISEEDRSFKDKSRVKEIRIPPKRRCEISVVIEEFGSVIEWEYIVKNKDIGFGLYFKESDEELTEIFPVWRFETRDGTETDSLRCSKTGTYVFVFDNTYSWMNTKEVSYCIRVKNLRERNLIE